MGATTNEKWEFDDPSRLLYESGSNGANDTERLANIVETRTQRAGEVASRLQLRRTDRVVEIGSGLGVTAGALAPLVQRLICADISPSFLEQCRLRNRGVPNVEPVLIDYADLSAVPAPVDKIYALLVFIHFNTYDFIYYLSECNRLLRVGGAMYFDFHDGSRVKLKTGPAADRGISRNLKVYKGSRSTWVFQCMHLNSSDTLKNLLPQLGFALRHLYFSDESLTQALIEKISDCPDFVPRDVA